MKTILIHRWGGNPESDWYPWLKDNTDVDILEMPNSDEPRIDEWVSFLRERIPDPTGITFIGHSVGCQTILRYLESVGGKAKKVIMVAPWIHLTDAVMSDEESAEIARPWIEAPMDFDSMKEHCDEFTSIFSRDDPYVPITDADIFRERLGSEIVIQEGMGHFDEDTDVRELPILLELIG